MNLRTHSITALLLFVCSVAGPALAQQGCYGDGYTLGPNGEQRHGTPGKLTCIYPSTAPATSGGGAANLERERAVLQQRDRELQQQVERDRALQQQRQVEQARQDQERRARNAEQNRRLLNAYQQQLDHLNQPDPGVGLPATGIDSAANEANMRSDMNALRQNLTGMSAADAVSDAAQALDALDKTATAKDPALDYAGQACAYFTQPIQRTDGSGLNVYADGSMVCYGERMYQCISRRWVGMGRCDQYSRSKSRTAELLERTTIGVSNPPYRSDITSTVKGQHQQSDFNALRDQIRNARTDEDLRAAGESVRAYNHHWGINDKPPTDLSGATGTAFDVLVDLPPALSIAKDVFTPTPTVTDRQIREQRVQQVNDEFLRQIDSVRGAPSQPPLR